MRKKRKFDKSNGIVIATIALCFMLTLTACYFLGGEGLIDSVFNKKTEGMSYYFIATSNYDDVTLARQGADLIRLRGGAGYVDMRDGNSVVVAVYPNKESADSVYQKLGDNSLIIKEIPLADYKIKVKDNDLKECIVDAVSCYEIAFESLYNLSNLLADNTLTVEDVNTQIKVLYAKIEDIKSVFYEKSKDSTLDIVTEVKLALVTCLAIIDGVEVKESVSTLSSIRRQTVQLVYCRQAFVSTLSNL